MRLLCSSKNSSNKVGPVINPQLKPLIAGNSSTILDNKERTLVGYKSSRAAEAASMIAGTSISDHLLPIALLLITDIGALGWLRRLEGRDEYSDGVSCSSSRVIVERIPRTATTRNPR